MKKVIVIGGGFSGLCAAKMLANYFDQVIVLDKDNLTSPEVVRRGIPQIHHLHVMLERGQKILEQYFPNFFKEADADGCEKIDWALDTCWESDLGKYPKYKSGIYTYSFSRQYLDMYLRKEVFKVENIFFIQAKVSGLNVKRGQINSVTLNDGAMIAGDYYVMATGHQNLLPKALPDYLSVEQVEINLTYYTTRFKRSELTAFAGKQYYYQLDFPISPVGGVITPVEKGEVIATIICQHDHNQQLPIMENQYKELARKIRSQQFFKIVEKAKALGAISAFHKKYMTKLIFKKPLPSNLTVIGDALCSLNPVFGQGMTISLMQVQELHASLANRCDRTTAKQKYKMIQTPYLLAKVGSARSGILKNLLRLYMKCATLSPTLHYYFLTKLHKR